MKKYIKYLIITTFVFVFMTLIFCFVKSNFNVMEWESKDRFLLVLLSFVGVMATSIFDELKK